MTENCPNCGYNNATGVSTGFGCWQRCHRCSTDYGFTKFKMEMKEYATFEEMRDDA